MIAAAAIPPFPATPIPVLGTHCATETTPSIASANLSTVSATLALV